MAPPKPVRPGITLNLGLRGALPRDLGKPLGDALRLGATDIKLGGSPLGNGQMSGSAWPQLLPGGVHIDVFADWGFQFLPPAMNVPSTSLDRIRGMVSGSMPIRDMGLFGSGSVVERVLRSFEGTEILVWQKAKETAATPLVGAAAAVVTSAHDAGRRIAAAGASVYRAASVTI